MGVYLGLVSHDKAFTSLKQPGLIINNFSVVAEEEMKRLRKLIYTTYDGDYISNLPTCDCGEIKGVPNLGVMCTNCGKEVVDTSNQELEPILWIKSPEGVRKLISPLVVSLLSETFTSNEFNVIRWFCDYSYNPKTVIPDWMQTVLESKFQRGYNNFIDNFYDIINFLATLRPFRGKNTNTEQLLELIERHRLDAYNPVFSSHIPLPNKAMLILEQNNSGNYTDKTVKDVVDAANIMAGIDSPLVQMKIRSKELRVAKTLWKLSDYYTEYIKTGAAKKEGLIRKHILATRSHWSARAVITSITNNHKYDELHVPWGVAVGALKLHIFNKLIKRGNTPNEMLGKVSKYAVTYNREIDDILNELIEESPYDGIPVTFGRNPSLVRASIQLMNITKVKKDTSDTTISMSILSVKGPNADFDGDEMGAMLALDNKTADMVYELAPHKSVGSLTEPYGISKNLSLPKPALSVMASWMEDRDDGPVTTDDMSFMESLA